MTFWRLFKIVTAFYSAIGAIGLLIGIAIDGWTQHGFYMPTDAGAPPHTSDPAFFFILGSWLFSVWFTSQRTFDRELGT